MAKRKRLSNKVKVSFIGNNSTGVTGSATLIEYQGMRVLLELGMTQEGTMLQNFQQNASFLESVDFSKISYVILCDSHIDHSGLLGYLGSDKSKFDGYVIMTPNAKRVTKHLLGDSAHIIKNDVDWLAKNKNIVVKEHYTQADVNKLFDFGIIVSKIGEPKKLGNAIEMKYLSNNHNIASASLELTFTETSGKKKRLFYSSDLGNTAQNMPFVAKKLDHCKSADVAIFESTYGIPAKERLNGYSRRIELNNLRKNLIQTLTEENGIVICPVFAFQRSQQFLSHIKDIYDRTPEIAHIPVIIDGRLMQNLNKEFPEMLEGEDLNKFQELMNWDRLSVLTDYQDTIAACNDDSPKIVVASSGMASNGKVVAYLEKFVGRSNTLLVFNGYCSPNSLGHRLLEKMDNPDKQFIKIGEKVHHYRAKVMRLYTFSSHMQYDELIDKISKMSVGKGIYLVHGSKESRLSLAEGLREAMEAKCKTTPIKPARRNMKIEF